MESSGIGQFIPLILIFVIFYFFLIRPQQKKVKEHKAMVEGLKKGDKIVTSGGITGTISRVIDNDKIEVEIADNVTVEEPSCAAVRSNWFVLLVLTYGPEETKAPVPFVMTLASCIDAAASLALYPMIT